MTLIAIGAFLLLVTVVAMAARPLLVPTTAPSAADEDAPELVQRKLQLLDAIRELDMDLATRKLSAEDHRHLRAQLVAEATAVMQRLDEEAASDEATSAVAGEEPAPDGAATDDVETAIDDVETAIEAEIARRRQRLAADDCQTCLDAREAGDAFCRRCGAAIDAPQEART